MKPLAGMTSAELAALRGQPTHVQTMRRPSNVTRGAWVYSDIEEYTAEQLALTVSALLGQGWTCSGAPFVRTYNPHAPPFLLARK